MGAEQGRAYYAIDRRWNDRRHYGNTNHGHYQALDEHPIDD
jgi:hypothetical protein